MVIPRRGGVEGSIADSPGERVVEEARERPGQRRGWGWVGVLVLSIVGKEVGGGGGDGVGGRVRGAAAGGEREDEVVIVAARRMASVTVRDGMLGDAAHFRWYFTEPTFFSGIFRKSSSFGAMRPIFP